MADTLILNWANTARALVITVVVLGLVIVGLWVLKVDIVLGPLRITGRSHH